jgi:predicted nuclease of restriction endonuclease-like (RecB) superfamily
MKEKQNKALLKAIKSLIVEAQAQIVRNVNTLMVFTYYQIGHYIIEDELKGKGRAKYAETTMRQLSLDLTKEFGKGYSKSNLEYMRQFYKAYQHRFKPIVQSPKEQSNKGVKIVQSVIGQFSSHFSLSWTHYIHLLKIEDRSERDFYEIEAVKGNWSVRELQRQFSSSLYERLALSRDKKSIRQLAKKGQIIHKPVDTLKSPIVLEFLDLKEDESYSESDLENAIISKLEHFMMELGKGFLFEGRQKRFTFEGENFYVDLVFYNRLLRCYVLFDLKIGKLAHQDIGQMQMYVNFYDRKIILPHENPTVGIILCKEENKTVIEFTLPEGNKTIFAKQYKLYLPSKEQLRKQLE